MNAINLLPAKSGRGGISLSGDGGRKGPAFALGAVAIIAAVGYMGFTARQEAATLADQVQQAQADKDQLDAQLQQLLAVDQQAAAQLQQRGSLVQLTSARINWERIMRDAMTVVPQGRISVTTIKGTAPDGAAATSAPAPAASSAQPQQAPQVQGLHIEGMAFGQPDVAQLLARLEAVPGLGSPRLTSADVVRKGDSFVVNFIIEIPVDQRAQDRPTLSVASSAESAAAQGVAPAGSAPGGMTP